MDANQSGYLRANLFLAHGNLALVQDAIEVAIAHFRNSISAAPADQLLIRGNAFFQLGNCLATLAAESDGDALIEEATDAFEGALRCYEALAIPSKVADCLHMGGNLQRFHGKFEAAIELHLRALEIYTALDDPRGCWMAADDASRAMLLHAHELEGTPASENWLEMALQISSAATVFSNRVWKSAVDNEELRKQLSVQLETHLVNRIEIAIAKAPALIHVALAHHKGRIRATRPDSIEMLCYLAGDDRMRDAIREEIAPALFNALVDGLKKLTEPAKRVAILDQWCIRGRTLITAITLIEGGRHTLSAAMSHLDSSIPDRPLADERRFYGAGRANPVQPVIDRLIENIRRGGDRALMFMRDEAIPSNDEQRQQLHEWSMDLSADAMLLGDWFFSQELLEFLREHAVDHVVLIPDPHYLGIPYLMLEADGQSIADQPWSLSIAGSLIDLGCIAARHDMSDTPAGGFTWLAPDKDVNSNRGGNCERAELEKLLDIHVVELDAATVEVAQAEVANGNWVHFRGHGRWDVTSDERGLVCHDGVLRAANLRSITDPKGAVLVTVACATGFAEVVGTETFGPLSEYDNAGLRSALLTLWPISGDAGTPFSSAFYRELAQGSTIASAFKAATKWMKEKCPHPFFWACFTLVGAWSTRIPDSAVVLRTSK